MLSAVSKLSANLAPSLAILMVAHQPGTECATSLLPMLPCKLRGVAPDTCRMPKTAGQAKFSTCYRLLRQACVLDAEPAWGVSRRCRCGRTASCQPGALGMGPCGRGRDVRPAACGAPHPAGGNGAGCHAGGLHWRYGSRAAAEEGEAVRHLRSRCDFMQRAVKVPEIVYSGCKGLHKHAVAALHSC